MMISAILTEDKSNDFSVSKNILKQHRTLEERAEEYGERLGPYKEFDWGEALGREDYDV